MIEANMETSPQEDGDELINEFLERQGYREENPSWEWSGNKKQCPECKSLHNVSAMVCQTCDWQPVPTDSP